jgi:hypothetical protein
MMMICWTLIVGSVVSTCAISVGDSLVGVIHVVCVRTAIQKKEDVKYVIDVSSGVIQGVQNVENVVSSLVIIAMNMDSMCAINAVVTMIQILILILPIMCQIIVIQDLSMILILVQPHFTKITMH